MPTYHLLLILDEIATGFGRTGALFAAELAGISPDIMCVGKALTGGYLPMAATLCTPHGAQAISTGLGGAFMHSPAFMANPLAAAVALASTKLLLRSNWRAEVSRIQTGLRAGLAPAARLPGAQKVRVLGAIGVVELHTPVNLAVAAEAAAAAGAWLRPHQTSSTPRRPTCAPTATSRSSLPGCSQRSKRLLGERHGSRAAVGHRRRPGSPAVCTSARTGVRSYPVMPGRNLTSPDFS